MSDDLKEKNGIGIPLEECLLPEEVDEILHHSSIAVFQRREIIFRQNTRTSHVMYVKSGLVKTYKEGRNKRSIILKLATAGDFLGIHSVYGHDMHQFSAAALQTAEIGFIDLASFNEVLQRNGRFAHALVQKLCTDGLYFFERLLAQSHKQLPGRIADVILYFSDILYKQEEFEFPLTRRELAELAGTTKESFIRTLTEFKNDKIIVLDGSKVRVNSMKIVRTLSNLG